MSHKSLIVELDPGVYLASGAGDPSLTLLKDNAKRFCSYAKATSGLLKARRYRDFISARIIECDGTSHATVEDDRSCHECGTAIMANGRGAHHSADCSMVGTDFNKTAPKEGTMYSRIREALEKIRNYGASKFKGDYTAAQIAKDALFILAAEPEPFEEIERDIKAVSKYLMIDIPGAPIGIVCAFNRLVARLNELPTKPDLSPRKEITYLTAQRDSAIDAVKKLMDALLPIVALEPFSKTGDTWSNGAEMSCGSKYGSNGKRDYMRNLARETLAATKPDISPLLRTRSGITTDVGE